MLPRPRYQRGDRIGGRYQVHKALMGGMGEVYLCLDLEEIQPYALKTFQQRYLTDTQRLRYAFEREVATWVALEKHPNIVRCFWMQTFDNQPFMVLEWIEGEEGKGTDLRSWLRRGPLDLKLALSVTIDVCRGLMHAQEKQPGLVHRDLKPENILMAQGGLAKITDFGLAQVVATTGLEVVQEGTEASSRQSFVGGKGIAGTPAYMAPEQWRGEALDARTDIYALGCILHELLAGRPPFQVEIQPTTPEMLQTWLSAMQDAHEHGRLAPLPVQATEAVRKLVHQCLSKAAVARPQHAQELFVHLTQIYQELFQSAPPIRPTAGDFRTVDYHNRGVTYVELRQYELALADFGQAIAIDPTLAPAFVSRGVTYADLHKYELALADYDQAIALDPFDAPAFVNRGNTYRALQQYELALADFGQAIALDPTLASAFANRGITYVELQQYELALADYDQAIALDSTLVPAFFNRGDLYRTLQQYELALRDFERAIALDPTYAKAYGNRGRTYDALQQYELALADYDQAIALDSTLAAAFLNRGVTYADLHEYELALADYDQAITIDPTYAKAFFNRGSLYRTLQQYELALTDFGQAIARDPTLVSAFVNRGATYDVLQQYELALADYDQAIALDSTFALAYSNRGMVYADLHKYELALADYDQAIALDPTYAPVFDSRGITYAALQQYELTLADFGRAIALDPTYALTYFNRGNIYLALQRYELALADYERAIALDPTNATAYLNIGAILGNQGRHQEALPYFEQAAQLGDPLGAQNAVQVRRMLRMEPAPTVDLVEQAFDAFLQAATAEAMRQAAVRYPVLLQADFIAEIEQVIAQLVPPEQRPVFEQRLAWLRQIATSQKPGFFSRLFNRGGE